MCGNQIEFSTEIGQGHLPFDSPDDARNVQQGRRSAKKRLVIGIEPDGVVSEEFANVKEIAGATAEIENVQGWSTVQPEVLGPFDIDSNPIINIFESIDLRRAGSIWKSFAQLFEPCTIETDKKTADVNRMQPSAGMFDQTGEQISGK